MDNRSYLETLLPPEFSSPGTEERLDDTENRLDGIDNAETGELAEIRAALVELADIVMGG